MLFRIAFSHSVTSTKLVFMFPDLYKQNPMKCIGDSPVVI
jgi:hypothetical protein